ncbi:MAG: hypothetical protein R2747_03705 [Pyrinomonadaceae bacterium]
MFDQNFGKLLLRLSLLVLVFVPNLVSGQEKAEKNAQPEKSIGGQEHQSEIYGVRIGMDIPTALRTVFINANRKPGQEKPDAMRREGKDKKDIRILYKDLPKGELQIVFAEGKLVREISLLYREAPLVDELRLPYTSTIGSNSSTIYSTSAEQGGVSAPAINDGSTSIEEFGSKKQGDIDQFSAKKIGNISRSQPDLLDGARYDDRYSVGFTDNLKLQRIWWREEKTEIEFRVRVAFIGKKVTQAGGRFVPSIVQKTVSVSPDDEEVFKKFLKESTRAL